MKYDFASNVKKPPPVDYLRPEESTITRPLTSSMSFTGGYAPGYQATGNIPSYTAPAIRRAPIYTPPPIGPTPAYVLPNYSSAPRFEGGQYRDLPTYSAPAWNEGEIDTLAQKRAAPGLRQLRQQIQRVTSRRFDNPQVGRMTLRDALQGYGSGVSQVMGGASVAAAGEYGQKYARTSENARAAHASQVDKARDYNRYQEDVARTNYQGSFAQWMAENQRLSDESKLRYGTDLARWEAENAATREAAKLNYGGSMDEWKTRTAADERTADRNYEGAMAKWGKESSYSLKQQEFDDAWERWKRQQLDPGVKRYSAEGIPVVANRRR